MRWDENGKWWLYPRGLEALPEVSAAKQEYGALDFGVCPRLPEATLEVPTTELEEVSEFQAMISKQDQVAAERCDTQ